MQVRQPACVSRLNPSYLNARVTIFVTLSSLLLCTPSCAVVQEASGNNILDVQQKESSTTTDEFMQNSSMNFSIGAQPPAAVKRSISNSGGIPVAAKGPQANVFLSDMDGIRVYGDEGPLEATAMRSEIPAEDPDGSLELFKYAVKCSLSTQCLPLAFEACCIAYIPVHEYFRSVHSALTNAGRKNCWMIFRASSTFYRNHEMISPYTLASGFSATVLKQEMVQVLKR
jgi:hypothetical protein